MDDQFFTQKYCDCCGQSLKDGRIMSMFNRDCICLDFKKKERKDKDYRLAEGADGEAIKKGDFNFPGIRK